LTNIEDVTARYLKIYAAGRQFLLLAFRPQITNGDRPKRVRPEREQRSGRTCESQVCVIFQAALRRAGALRRERAVAALRRRLPGRFSAVFCGLARRAGFALRLLFVIFAICCSLSFSLCCHTCPLRITTTRQKEMMAND
jgi:hypothetical protein